MISKGHPPSRKDVLVDLERERKWEIPYATDSYSLPVNSSSQTNAGVCNYARQGAFTLQRAHLKSSARKYRVILKKVPFGIFRTILVSKEEKFFTIKSKDKGLSLGKFS